MTDFFAVLRLPARPWLDPEPLNEAYVRRSEALHRTADSQDQLMAVNRAHRVLSDPASRVEHLLSLTGQESNTTRIVPTVGEFFERVARHLQRADRLLAGDAAQTSALLRALRAQEMQTLKADLEELATELGSYRTGRLKELKELDRLWERAPADARQDLAQLALDLTFIQKWQGQVRERLLRLDEAAAG
ncbi:MAG: hypothetical protein JO069_09120 [Verrucomicrobia bacterium]|nr:hypothetical protein [Verrucomicrobiota bacterium]